MSTILQTNIKKQLSEKNMTAAELERRTGIPHAVINILHGRSKNPSIRTAQAIAKELGCTVEELISESSCTTKQTDTNSIKLSNKWDAELYLQATKVICMLIQNTNANPDPIIVAECITEVYLYAQGGEMNIIDQRFAEWIVNKKLLSN